MSRPDDKTWALWRDVGTWATAVGLLIYEGVVRHFVDQSGIAILGGLLGLPVIVNFERARRDRNDDNEKE